MLSPSSPIPDVKHHIYGASYSNLTAHPELLAVYKQTGTDTAAFHALEVFDAAAQSLSIGARNAYPQGFN